eukprot:579625-Pyramimonas_sp.AAC.2
MTDFFAFSFQASNPASRSCSTGSAKSMCMVVPPARAASWPLRSETAHTVGWHQAGRTQGEGKGGLPGRYLR